MFMPQRVQTDSQDRLQCQAGTSLQAGSDSLDSLSERIRTLELVTFGEDTIVIGSVLVSLSSTLSATAAAFVPTAPSSIS